MNKLKEKLLQKSNLWHVGAIVGFIIVASIYFSPTWSGYTIKQGDVTNYVGMSQEIKDYRATEGQIGWTNSMFSGMPSDQISKGFKGREIPNFLRSVYSLWLPKPIVLLFSYFLSFYLLGLSFKVKPIVAIIGALAFGFSSSHIIILEAGHITKAFAIGYAPLVVAGMVMAYRSKNWILGVSLSALFLTFELFGNHVQITYYLIFVLIALGIVELVRHLKKEGGIKKFAKVTGGLLVAYGIAAMINIGNLIGTSEYAKHTTRGGTELTINADGTSNDGVTTSGLDKEYITAWSYGIGETFTFIVPNFKGGETQAIGSVESNKEILKDVPPQSKQFVGQNNQYYGDQPFTSGPVYLGVIVVFLAFLGLVYGKDKARWGLLAATLLTVMLSWGKNLMGLTDVFLDNLPGYNKFRAVTIILAVAQLCVPILGIMFLQRLIKSRDMIASNMRPFFIVSGIFGFLLLTFLAAPTAVNDFVSSSEEEALNGITDPATYDYYSVMFDDLATARASIFQKDVLRSLVFLILTFGLTYLYVKEILKNKYIFLSSLGLLILIDLVGVDTRYLSTEKKGRNYVQWEEKWKQKYPYEAGGGDIEIFNQEAAENPNLIYAVDSAFNATDFEGMENAERKRVQDWLQFRVLNRYTNYRVFDLSNPFNSSYASYFHKSIGGYHGAKLGRYQELIEFHIGKGNPAVLDMLNCKYQIASSRDANGNSGSQFVKKNETAMGNAWFTKNVKVVESADEEILALESANAATLTIPETEFEVLFNGEVSTGEFVVDGQESVSFIAPMPQEDGSMALDTIPQQLPVQQAAAFDLSLIHGQQPGTWNWAYDEMLDSSMVKIMTLTTADRKGWDPEKETVVHKDFMDNVSQESYSAVGEIKMKSYHPDNIEYKFSSPDKQLVVFSEIYYPLGWKAFVDNKEVDMLRVNYTLRAIEVPAGEHSVSFVYDLPSDKTATTLTWVGSILLFLLLAFGVYAKIKGIDETENDEEDEEDEELSDLDQEDLDD